MKAPDWIDAWIGEAPVQGCDGPHWHGELRRGTRFTHLRVVVPGAATLPDQQLSDATRTVYQGMREALDGAHPIRFWNFVPGILGTASRRRDRYMVFNAGRHEAFDDWFDVSDPEAFAALMPAATGVGIDGDDLLIDCLADRVPGVAIENPRQTAAFRYSARYGPRPPCFARATRVAFTEPLTGGAPDEGSTHDALLISGTASIVGEDSLHIGRPLDQLHETLTNLQALIEAAGGNGLSDLVSARLYHREPDIDPAVRAALIRRLPDLPVELSRVTLCRPDLAIEIEAVARFAGTRSFDRLAFRGSVER